MIRTLGQLQTIAVNDPKALLTPGEVAAVFRVDPKTVTRWGLAGKIPSVKTPGGHRRFRADDVCRSMGVFE